MDKSLEELVQKAEQAYKNAYAPYSAYPVGAAVLWDSGRITAGCNVENASYGLTVCAERNAVFQGVALGERIIQAVAIAVPNAEMPTPCGSCRQVVREFAEDCLIILRNGLGQTAQTSLAELLPNSFGPDFLNKKISK